MSDLYDGDILRWSEHQAGLLRRLAAGELVNDSELDWSNIAEEIEDVGSNRLHAVESLLVQAMRHILKAEAWPLSLDAPSWLADAIDFRRQARRCFVPSLQQKIDVAALYTDTLAALPGAVDGQPPLPVLDAWPVTLDERCRKTGRRHRADQKTGTVTFLTSGRQGAGHAHRETPAGHKLPRRPAHPAGGTELTRQNSPR